MRRFLLSSKAIVLTLTIGNSAAFAAGMNMPMAAAKPAQIGVAAGYRFELVGPPQSAGAGKSAISVRLISVADKKPVVGAIIVWSRADMAPIGMGGMKAPVSALPATKAGIYRFEVQNGSAWNKTDRWALRFAAKVPGKAATVQGSIIVELKP